MRKDPERYRQYQLKEKERYKRKKEKGQVKQVDDMTPTELRRTRRNGENNRELVERRTRN